MRLKKMLGILFFSFSFLSFLPLAQAQSYYEDDDNDHYSYYDNNAPTYDDSYRERDERYARYEEEMYSPPPRREKKRVAHKSSYKSRLPSSISAPGERVIIVNPAKHVWGAYSSRGELLRAGLATSGRNWCPDIGRPCRTKTGVFRIASLGDSDCISNKYPIETGGGAPMPYCMYFNGGQGIHGSYQVADANLSHGCVRVSVADAKWIRFNFADVGTKVIIKSY